MRRRNGLSGLAMPLLRYRIRNATVGVAFNGWCGQMRNQTRQLHRIE